MMVSRLSRPKQGVAVADENAKASRTKSGLEKNAGRLLARDEGMAWLDGSLDSLDSMLESHLTSKQPVAWRLAPGSWTGAWRHHHQSPVHENRYSRNSTVCMYVATADQ